jgi:hypothetical protein
MKKILKIFGVGVLMNALCVGLVACNEPKESDSPEEPEVIGVLPLPEFEVPEEVSAFFKEQLSLALSDNFSVEEGRYEPVFSTINSEEELRTIVPSTVELPWIDFAKYTLVIGQYYTTGGFYLKSHSINPEPAVMEMNLVFGDTGKGLGAMFLQRYCNLYQQLPSKSIDVNVTTIKEY